MDTFLTICEYEREVSGKLDKAKVLAALNDSIKTTKSYRTAKQNLDESLDKLETFIDKIKR